MGLLNSILGGLESGRMTSQEAFAGVLMCASGCDGHIASEEISGLVTTLARMKLYQRFNDKQYGQMLDKLHGMLKKKGVDVLLETCVDQLPAELRETAFANACDLVLADGVVEDEEKAFIDKLHKKLELDKKVAAEIAQVMVIKNKG